MLEQAYVIGPDGTSEPFDLKLGVGDSYSWQADNLDASAKMTDQNGTTGFKFDAGTAGEAIGRAYEGDLTMGAKFLGKESIMLPASSASEATYNAETEYLADGLGYLTDAGSKKPEFHSFIDGNGYALVVPVTSKQSVGWIRCRDLNNNGVSYANAFDVVVHAVSFDDNSVPNVQTIYLENVLASGLEPNNYSVGYSHSFDIVGADPELDCI